MSYSHAKLPVLAGMLVEIVFALFYFLDQCEAHVTYIEARFPLKVSSFII